jgi:hypothetical protein
MEQRPFFYGKEGVAERARYQTMPLAELPAAQLREYGGSALRQTDWAARLDSLDWQGLQRIQAGGMETLPAELGPLQVLARALRVRFRAEVGGRHYDDAVHTGKTMFALARHLGEHPAELSGLVGMWVAHLGLVTLQEMVQQPACPNLYWALTDLPCPLVDVRKGVQGGRALLATELLPIRDKTVMTEREIESIVSHLSGLMSFAREQAGHAPRSLRRQLATKVGEPGRLSAARRRLAQAGASEEDLLKLPPAQVILLDEKLEFEIQQDERIKLLSLPLWQITDGNGDAEVPPDGLFADLLPGIIKLRQTQAMLQQEIALLRQVEALRLYAAAHGGTLPAKLSDIALPPPIDPVTGKTFAYEVNGETAHLRGRAIRSGEGDPGRIAHFEVIFCK